VGAAASDGTPGLASLDERGAVLASSRAIVDWVRSVIPVRDWRSPGRAAAQPLWETNVVVRAVVEKISPRLALACARGMG
jgi:hypothetical protein